MRDLISKAPPQNPHCLFFNAGYIRTGNTQKRRDFPLGHRGFAVETISQADHLLFSCIQRLINVRMQPIAFQFAVHVFQNIAILCHNIHQRQSISFCIHINRILYV